MFKRIVIGFAVLVVLVVGAVLVFPGLLPLETYKAEIARQVQRATGREFAINGDVRLNLIPRFELEARDVTFGNAPGASEPHMARLDELELRMKLLPLLFGRIEVDRFVLVQPVIHLEVDEAGKANWDLPIAVAGREEPAADPSDTAFELDILKLADIRLENGTITLHNRRTKRTAEIKGVNILFQLPEGESAATDKGEAPAKDQTKADAEPEVDELLDLPILPSGFRLRDATLEVGIASITGDRVAIRDYSFRGEVKDGRVADSPLAVTVGETAFTGTVSLDLRGDEPKAAFRLESGKVDIGRILDRLEIAKGVDSAVEKSTLTLGTTGATLRKMIDGLEMVAALEGGHITLTGPQSGGKVTVAVETATAEEKPGQPFTLAINGSIAKIPVEILTETDRLLGFVERPDKLSFKTDIKAVGVDLGFRGSTALPLDRGQQELTTTLKGKSLASLSPLVDVALPPLGPYSLDAKVTRARDKYTLSKLDLRFGKSDLGGTGILDFKGGKPRIDIKLATKTIQINDFIPAPEKLDKAGKSIDKDTKPTTEKRAKKVAAARDAAAGKAAEAEKQWRALDAPEFMQSFDAALALKVDQVLSGADKLGSGTLEAKLENGRFDITNLHVAVPGGAVETKFGFKPDGKSVSTDLAIQSKGFDYGILARRIDPKATPEGTLDLDIALDSRGPSLEDLMVNANGRFNFAVYPKNMDADIFDLWAANLVLLLLSTAEKDADSKSTLNCLVGRFEMKDGIMKEEALLMDTTTLVVAGEAEVNFKTRRVNARVAPTAKRPKMFSAPAPISVDGSFDDFNVGVKFGDLIGTAFQFTTSVVTVPLLRLFGGRPPEDGSEACRKLMAGEAAAGEEKRAE